MKDKWKNHAQDLIREVIPPAPQTILTVEKKSDCIRMSCLSCDSDAEVIYQGTSFCKRCVKEKLRVGR